MRDSISTTGVGLAQVNQFLNTYKAVELPILQNTVGDTLIKPDVRKHMKEAFQTALVEDLNNLLDPVAAEAVVTADGIIVVAENDIEGFYCIQLDTKFKNLDYDPYDAANQR